ncbi:hypothetical protein QOZ80_6BG0474140 [Eleusine coracana subsp. coracana]|nr:hypothetical protein QOZ80_6BG0474140 [Eleusine coracana subsp. coracana]
MHALNFHKKPNKSRKKINRWIAKATNNLIVSALSKRSVHEDTALVLAHTIYFKGKWMTPFLMENTKVEKFYLFDGTTVDVPFMRSGGNQMVVVHEGFKVLKLPYRSSTAGDKNTVPEFSMRVFLPDCHDVLWSLIEQIACSRDYLHDHLPTKMVEVTKLLLPKFKTSFSKRLSGILKDIGLKITFDPNKADLSDMVEDDCNRSALSRRRFQSRIFLGWRHAPL